MSSVNWWTSFGAKQYTLHWPALSVHLFSSAGTAADLRRSLSGARKAPDSIRFREASTSGEPRSHKSDRWLFTQRSLEPAQQAQRLSDPRKLARHTICAALAGRREEFICCADRPFHGQLQCFSVATISHKSARSCPPVGRARLQFQLSVT